MIKQGLVLFCLKKVEVGIKGNLPRSLLFKKFVKGSCVDNLDCQVLQ